MQTMASQFCETKKEQKHEYWALIQGLSGTFSDLECENRRYSLQVISNISLWLIFFRKGIVRGNLPNTMQPKGPKSVEKFRSFYRKTDKESEKSSFCVKFDLVCGRARLHISKRLGKPSFFIKRSHLSNIRVKSEGVVATAWWVSVEWPLS